MIDPKLLRTDPDRVRRSQKARGESVDLVDEALAADEARRSSISAFETARAEQKSFGARIAKASGDEKKALLARTKELSAQVKALQAAADEADAAYTEIVKQFGNIVFEDVPAGGEDDLYVIDEVGSPRDFAAEGIEVKDHLELGEGIGAIDMERGAKVSGSRFYFLTGPGALLEFALIQFALTKALAWGLTPVIPPALVNPEAMDGTGFLGQAADDVYYLERDNQYLVGTAEVPLAAYHSGEILDAGELPIRLAGFSPAFRREAGSYGKDTRGIFRVHWFDKFEMFTYCRPEDAVAEHQRLLENEREFITDLGIPFQVLDVASGDLGASAARKYDCYGWVPSQGRYREITSTSNCTQFQARRLGIRMRDGKNIEHVATLNGTLCAMSRMILMILENYQQADGSVVVPEVLRPYLGGQELFETR
ncbi:serine--tRNA ligase [Propionibacterium australiense]|uniref:Serine--tRNA ligase n=1 Tax=Propionibacterium australiense TaxID=119981 RepID=A0A383S6T3_9ACTN|nr:serine--tRNA ligase [Propionibacterium australiense]RLP08169.1 serine--tRNA ligase [Propionibacterium australiense]RLP08303.1 serine--tRNA ligase [Propionibacterium australiense]SYZ33079.1 Serine-tRNA ligase [Propionibacterium australiense]VEH89078.1 Serine--tRNA ligase [Propionibacterium australiense]